MNSILFVVGLAALIYFAWDIGQAYLAATGSGVERVWFAVKSSATIAWSHILALSSALLVVVGQLADAAGDPDLKTQIMAWIQPEYVPALTLLIAVITYIARRRSLV